MNTSEEGSGPVSGEKIKARALALAASVRVITISSSSPHGAWAAPVYYVFSGGMFYFFSSPDARHVKETGQTETYAAAALFSDNNTVRQIRGLQMQGRVKGAGITTASASAASAYIKKFGIDTGAAADTLDYFKTVYRAGMYRFVPVQSYYMDNSIGFGFRTGVDL